jgi:hypothetical protein
MPDIPFGQLLVLIAFILVPLINVLLERVRRWRFQRQVPREEPPQQPSPRTFVKPPPLKLAAPASERVPAREVGETPPRPRRQRRKKTFFTSRRDLRRAVILMAVIGPCRAVDPADAERRQFPPSLGG